MTEKERLEEVRKNIEEVLVKARQARVKSNGIANFILYALSQEDITDQILSLKDKDGKPMLGIISDDQSLPCRDDEYNNINTKPPEYRYAINDMLASNFRRVIIEEEK